jgi:hypothetical protein
MAFWPRGKEKDPEKEQQRGWYVVVTANLLCELNRTLTNLQLATTRLLDCLQRLHARPTGPWPPRGRITYADDVEPLDVGEGRVGPPQFWETTGCLLSASPASLQARRACQRRVWFASPRPPRIPRARRKIRLRVSPHRNSPLQQVRGVVRNAVSTAVQPHRRDAYYPRDAGAL